VRMYHLQQLAGGIALINLILAVCINELCTAGDYVAERPGVIEIGPGHPSRKCQSSLGEVLKYLSSAATLALLVLIVRGFKLMVQHELVEAKAIYHHKSNSLAIPLIMKLRLVIELLVTAIHPAPMISAFDVAISMLGSTVHYRVESILCAASFFKIYHLITLARMGALFKYFAIEQSEVLRDQRTLKLLEDSKPKHKMLAFKVAIAKHPVQIIGTSFLFLILTVAYLFRISEGPAYQEHSVWFWDQVWFIVVTLTTTGFGDIVPFTHMGRFTSVVSMAIGPVVVAFLTASVTRALTLSEDEQHLIARMEVNRLQYQVLDSGVRIIQGWWRKVSGREQSRFIRVPSLQTHAKQQQQEKMELRRRFYKAILAFERNKSIKRQRQKAEEAESSSKHEVDQGVKTMLDQLQALRNSVEAMNSALNVRMDSLQINFQDSFTSLEKRLVVLKQSREVYRPPLKFPNVPSLTSIEQRHNIRHSSQKSRSQDQQQCSSSTSRLLRRTDLVGYKSLNSTFPGSAFGQAKLQRQQGTSPSPSKRQWIQDLWDESKQGSTYVVRSPLLCSDLSDSGGRSTCAKSVPSSCDSPQSGTETISTAVESPPSWSRLASRDSTTGGSNAEAAVETLRDLKLSGLDAPLDYLEGLLDGAAGSARGVKRIIKQESQARNPELRPLTPFVKA